MNQPGPNLYLELHEQGWTDSEIADHYGIKVDSVRRQINIAKKGQNSPYFERGSVSVPESANRSLAGKVLSQKESILAQLPKPVNHVENPLSIPDANVLIIGDLHIPYHNPRMLELAVDTRDKRHSTVRTCAIGGDLFDFSSLSNHPKNQPETSPNETLYMAGQVLRWLGARFDALYICNGNHDERLSKKLDRAWDLQLLINAALGKEWPKSCEIHVTNLDYIYVGETWLIGHPSAYSGQGGKTPSELAQLYHKNVICLHNHVIGMSASKDGDFIGIDTGHMTDPESHYYIQRRLTKFPRWIGGFTVLENEYPHLYTDRWTDWEHL